MTGVNQTQIENRLRYEENVMVTRLTVHKTIKANENVCKRRFQTGNDPVYATEHTWLHNYTGMIMQGFTRRTEHLTL